MPSPRAFAAQRLGTEAVWRQELRGISADPVLKDRFFEYAEAQRKRLVNARNRAYAVLLFLQFQARQGCVWRELGGDLVELYVDTLQAKSFHQDTIREHQRSILSWARFLFRRLEIPQAPEVPLRRVPSPKNSRQPLTYQEIRKLMSLPRLELATGLRDRALLEVAYSTAMRPLELEWMQMTDIDFSEQTVLVRKPKNRQERLVPLTAPACHFLQRYLLEARPKLQTLYSGMAVWLGEHGRPLRVSRLTVNRLHGAYAVRDVFGRHIGLYHLRHSLATHLLANGADLVMVRQWLGHECLRSTQHYLHQRQQQLRQVLVRCHPLESELSQAEPLN
jgi:site-specific recombinase XerD